jgi:hypothetical protein
MSVLFIATNHPLLTKRGWSHELLSPFKKIFLGLTYPVGEKCHDRRNSPIPARFPSHASQSSSHGFGNNPKSGVIELFHRHVCGKVCSNSPRRLGVLPFSEDGS